MATTIGGTETGMARVVDGVKLASGLCLADITDAVGVAAFDAGSGDEVTVLRGGIHTLAASGAIAAGELVTTAASGAVATQGTPSAANDVQVIGVALSAAASSLVKVLLFR